MKKSKFEISKVYTIRGKKYRYKKIRVCYKDSIPLFGGYHEITKNKRNCEKNDSAFLKRYI